MIYREIQIHCVQCQSQLLIPEEALGLSYLICPSCEGLWLTEEVFLSFMEQNRPGKDNTLLLHNDGTKRRSCPVCKEPMQIAWILFLQMDQCEEHGIWFDKGELNRALHNDVGEEFLKQIDSRVKQRRRNRSRQKPFWNFSGK